MFHHLLACALAHTFAFYVYLFEVHRLSSDKKRHEKPNCWNINLNSGTVGPALVPLRGVDSCCLMVPPQPWPVSFHPLLMLALMLRVHVWWWAEMSVVAMFATRADAVAESMNLNGLYVNHGWLWWLWITLEVNNCWWRAIGFKWQLVRLVTLTMWLPLTTWSNRKCEQY